MLLCVQTNLNRLHLMNQLLLLENDLITGLRCYQNILVAVARSARVPDRLFLRFHNITKAGTTSIIVIKIGASDIV